MSKSAGSAKLPAYKIPHTQPFVKRMINIILDVVMIVLLLIAIYNGTKKD